MGTGSKGRNLQYRIRRRRQRRRLQRACRLHFHKGGVCQRLTCTFGQQDLRQICPFPVSLPPLPPGPIPRIHLPSQDRS